MPRRELLRDRYGNVVAIAEFLDELGSAELRDAREALQSALQSAADQMEPLAMANRRLDQSINRFLHRAVDRAITAPSIRFGSEVVTVAEPPKANCMLSTGVEIEATVRRIDHPNGRFRDATGRFDICIMEVGSDPSIRVPEEHWLFGSLEGERTQTAMEKLNICPPRQLARSCG